MCLKKRKSDGKFHTIKVELPQQHSYQLRYRKGYWAIPRGQAVAMSPAAAQLYSRVPKWIAEGFGCTRR